jgi:hypothetical protein
MRGMNQVEGVYASLSINNNDKLYVSGSNGTAKPCCLQYENE